MTIQMPKMPAANSRLILRTDYGPSSAARVLFGRLDPAALLAKADQIAQRRRDVREALAARHAAQRSADAELDQMLASHAARRHSRRALGGAR